MRCDIMFKPSYYYCVIHYDFGITYPIKCLIKVRDKDTIPSHSSWNVKIIKIFSKYDGNRNMYEGMETGWLEDWCKVLKEYDHCPNDAEILAYML